MSKEPPIKLGSALSALPVTSTPAIALVSASPAPTTTPTSSTAATSTTTTATPTPTKIMTAPRQPSHSPSSSSAPAPGRRRPSPSPPALLRRARTWSLCLLYALECCPHQRQWQVNTFLSIRERLQYAIDRRPTGEDWQPEPLDVLPTEESREGFVRAFAGASAQARTFLALDTADVQTRTSRMMNVMLSFELLRLLAALPQGKRRAATREQVIEALDRIHPLDFGEKTPEAFRDMTRFMDALKLASDNIQQIWPVLPQIDATIQRSSKKWRVERMASIDRNILRLATFELRHRPDVPPRVALNEAIELAKTFGAQAARGFVNGILQQICNDNGIALS